MQSDSISYLLFQATRYNYTDREKFAMGELITLIKSLQNMLQHIDLYMRPGMVDLHLVCNLLIIIISINIQSEA